MDLIPYLYYERQEAGSQLCAQHCLNNLLQQHSFSEFDLAEIAQRLDIAENAALAPANQNKKSYNYNDTGFFSISVLERAMEVWDLTLVRWRGEAMKPYQAHPEDQAAFILNLSQHWLPLRRFSLDPHAPAAKKRWYNLNSFLPNGPEWISPTYLRMVLEAAEKEGYSVFVVRKARREGGEGMPSGEGEGWTDGGIGVLPESIADRMALELGAPSGRGGVSVTPSGSTSRGARVPLESDNPDQPTVDAASLPSQAGPSSPPARRNRRQEDLAPVSPDQDGLFPAASGRRRLKQPNTSTRYVEDDDDEEIASDDFDMDPTGETARPGARGHYDPIMDEEAHLSGPTDFAMQSRSYDDEDEALQAALKASMQDLPADWKAPEINSNREPVSRAADRIKAANEKAQAAMSREKKLREELEEEEKKKQARKNEEEEEDKEEKFEDLSPDEIRRRRLARFG